MISCLRLDWLGCRHGANDIAAGARRPRAFRLRVPADDRPRGGLVLLQEIFGITGHIRRVCDGFAAQGYHVVAPALFDRVRPGIELGYGKEDAANGRDLRSRISWDQVFADVLAAKEQLKTSGKVATIGYCWGGTISWRSAVHVTGLAAAVCYYATQIDPMWRNSRAARCSCISVKVIRSRRLNMPDSYARRRVRRSKSRFIPQATASTATRFRLSINLARPWRYAARWTSCQPTWVRSHDSSARRADQLMFSRATAPLPW